MVQGCESLPLLEHRNMWRKAENLSVPVRLSDLDHSIAVAEKTFGAGRVCAFA